MIGEWEWEVIGPSSSWAGHLDFAKADGQLTFSGKEYSVEKAPEGAKRTLIFEVKNGKAALINGASLTLESDVQEQLNPQEHVYGRKFHWKSVAPLAIIPTFRGQLRPGKARRSKLVKYALGNYDLQESGAPGGLKERPLALLGWLDGF